MLNSMTGFSRHSVTTSKGAITVEVKSVNHRFLDISLRVPQRYSALEEHIRRQIAKRFDRGKIDLSITMDGSPFKGGKGLSLNIPLAREYYELYGKLKEEFRLPGEVDLSLMAGIRDLFHIQEEAEDVEQEWEVVKGAVHQCLEGLYEMRAREGAILLMDMEQRIGRIEEWIGEIQNRSSEVMEDFRKRLEERIREKLGGLELNAERIHQEVVYFAERSDISEECLRMQSHLQQFRELTGRTGRVGRKLDFLLQEMHREVTTIGAKAADAPISHWVVEVKGELERIREQVQNIE